MNRTSQPRTRRGAISAGNAIFLAIIIAALTTVLLVRGRSQAELPASEPLFAHTTSFADARTQAADQDKLVFVLATADWCGPCRSLRGGTLADPAVQAQLEQVAVAYKLDVTNEQLPPEDAQLAASLGVTGIPALFLIQGDNTVLASAVGDMSASQFTSWLNSASESRR